MGKILHWQSGTYGLKANLWRLASRRPLQILYSPNGRDRTPCVFAPNSDPLPLKNAYTMHGTKEWSHRIQLDVALTFIVDHEVDLVDGTI